jgi:fimbrial chaperone protein
MQAPFRRRQLFAALAGIGVAPSNAHAAGLQFSPILLDLGPGQRTATLEIMNRSADPRAVQVRPFTWSQPTGQDDALGATNDLAISPPLFTLPPNEMQLVRIVLRASGNDAAERAYRLLIDELPPPGQAGAVRLALRVSLPVFAAASSRTAPDIRWSAQRAGSGWDILAHNQGTRRARITELSATGPGGRRLAATPLAQNPWLLQGGHRRWRLEDPGRIVRSGSTLRVVGTSETGPLEVVIAAVG